MPAEFLSLCRRAESLPALRAVGFGPRLRGDWPGMVQAWWETIARPELWDACLNDLCGRPVANRNVSYYLGMVKNRRHDPVAPPARAAPAEDYYVPPVPLSSVPKRSANALPARKTS